MSKKVKIILGIVIAFVVLGVAAAGWWIYKKGKVGADTASHLWPPIQPTFQILSVTISTQHDQLAGFNIFGNGRYIENVQLAPPADLRGRNVSLGEFPRFVLFLSGTFNQSFADNIQGAAVLEQNMQPIAVVSLGNGEQLYDDGIVSEGFSLNIPAAGASYTVHFVQTSQGDYGEAGNVWTSEDPEWSTVSLGVLGVEGCPDLRSSSQSCQNRTVESAVGEGTETQMFRRFRMGSYQPAAATQPAAAPVIPTDDQHTYFFSNIGTTASPYQDRVPLVNNSNGTSFWLIPGDFQGNNRGSDVLINDSSTVAIGNVTSGSNVAFHITGITGAARCDVMSGQDLAGDLDWYDSAMETHADGTSDVRVGFGQQALIDTSVDHSKILECFDASGQQRVQRQFTVRLSGQTQPPPEQTPQVQAPTIPGVNTAFDVCRQGGIEASNICNTDVVTTEADAYSQYNQSGTTANISLGQKARFRFGGITNIIGVSDAECRAYSRDSDWDHAQILGALSSDNGWLSGFWGGSNGIGDGRIVFGAPPDYPLPADSYVVTLECRNSAGTATQTFTVNVTATTATEPGTGGQPPAQPTAPQFDGDFTVRVSGRTDVVALPNPQSAIAISFNGSERNATIDFNTRNVSSCSINPAVSGVSVANNNQITISASGWNQFPQTFELNCGGSARQSFAVDAIETPITGDNQQQECPAGLENFAFAGDQWHIMTLPYEINGDYGIVELFLNPQNLVNIFPFNPNYAGEGSQAYLPRTSAAARGTGFWIAKSGSGTITEQICKNRVNVNSRNQNVELNPVQLGQSGIYMVANPFDAAIPTSSIQVNVAGSGWKSLSQAISEGWVDSVHLPHWPLEWSNTADAPADQRGWYDSYYSSQDVFPRENATAWQIERFHAIGDGAPTLEPLRGTWILLPYSNQTFEVRITHP